MSENWVRRGRTSTGSPCAQVQIADAAPGQVVELTGYVHCLTLHPNQSPTTFEAEISDDSGSLTLVWLGRRRVTGVEPGRRITVRGRVTRSNDVPTIFNPEYELSIPSAS